jgi:NADPH-dependent 2,4-dienoyl-CoA reductase/sulfur reductase-like enzyme
VNRQVIVGGSDTGMMAGLRAREVDPTTRPMLIVADAYPNFSICGIPCHICGEVPDWRRLAHRSLADLKAPGFELLLGTRADTTDPSSKTVTFTSPTGTSGQIPYDTLILGKGAIPVRPPIASLDTLGLSTAQHGRHIRPQPIA